MQSDCKEVTRARANWPLRNLALALALMGLMAVGARAQGVRYDNIVLGPSGHPVSSAKIAVCTAAAVRTTTPCSPLAKVYSDQVLTQPMANPFTADSLGNYGFWAEPGHYVVQIYGTGVTMRTMDVFLACDPSNCSMTSATVSSITAGTLNLTGSLTVDGRNVATEPLPSDAVQYVSPNGSDSNDGLSWGTAKQTLYAAVNSLESASGGTVYVAPNTACGGPVAGQGLWLVGFEDPTGYANPPAGWIKMQHALKIVGEGVNTVAAQNSPAPAAQINCGSAGNNPAIWISGVSMSGLEIDNLAVSTAANNALVIGVSTSGSRTASGGSDLLFNNDSFAVGTGGSVGPTIDIGSNVFWVRFNDVGISADSGAPALSDTHQAVVINPVGGTGVSDASLIYFNHLLTDYGGIHFYGDANNGGSLFVDHYMIEGDNDGSPAVHISTDSNKGGQALYRLQDIEVADASVSPTYAVQVDPGIPAGDTLVSGVLGFIEDVEGPMVMLGDVTNFPNTTEPPTMQNIEGFLGGRLWSRFINDGNLSFGLQSPPFPDVISPVPTSTVSGVPNWGGQPVTAVAAPDGTKNAYELPANASNDLTFTTSNYTVNTNDYFVVGAWFRLGPGGTGYHNGEPLQFQVLSGSACVLTPVASTAGVNGFGGDYLNSNWQWSFAVEKVTTAGSCTIEYGTNPTADEEVFAPVMLHVPASAGLSDADAMNLGINLRSTSPVAATGAYATLPNHPIAFGGSGDNYMATLDHTALSTNRTYDFPNQSGTIALVLSGTSGSIGGSALAAGACTTGTASISGATTSMTAAVSPAADPGSGFTWEGWISAAGTATVRVCNVSGASATPTAEAYNVRVIQ